MDINDIEVDPCAMCCVDSCDGCYLKLLKIENARLREALESAATNLEVAGFYASAKEARAALKV